MKIQKIAIKNVKKSQKRKEISKNANKLQLKTQINRNNSNKSQKRK